MQWRHPPMPTHRSQKGQPPCMLKKEGLPHACFGGVESRKVLREVGDAVATPTTANPPQPKGLTALSVEERKPAGPAARTPSSMTESGIACALVGLGKEEC